MPASQSASNVLVAFKVQSGISAPASGAGASGLRVKPSQSLKLNKQYINSEEVRRDGMTTRGRQGSRSSSAGYASELSLGSFDALIEAALRGTFTVSTDITQATMTSVTTTTTTIVASAGSWLTQGVRRGDMIKLTGFADAANNAKWFRVISVTASTITVAGTAPLVLNATPDSTFTVTVAKNVIQGSPPVERYFSLEEYQQDIDSSLYGTDMKVVKMDFNAQPNRNIEVTFTFMGLDAQSLTGASSPGRPDDADAVADVSGCVPREREADGLVHRGPPGHDVLDSLLRGNAGRVLRDLLRERSRSERLHLVLHRQRSAVRQLHGDRI
jgi:hypothetical protein